MIGFNSRLDEIQAGVLRVLLPKLDSWVEDRRALARHYHDAGLAELAAEPVAVEGADPAWHLYVIRHADADSVVESLNAAGVESRGYYRTPIHLQAPMRSYYDGRQLPATDEASRTNLAIPMGPGIGPDEASKVVAALRAASPAAATSR